MANLGTVLLTIHVRIYILYIHARRRRRRRSRIKNALLTATTPRVVGRLRGGLIPNVFVPTLKRFILTYTPCSRINTIYIYTLHKTRANIVKSVLRASYIPYALLNSYYGDLNKMIDAIVGRKKDRRFRRLFPTRPRPYTQIFRITTHRASERSSPEKLSDHPSPLSNGRRSAIGY